MSDALPAGFQRADWQLPFLFVRAQIDEPFTAHVEMRPSTIGGNDSVAGAAAALQQADPHPALPPNIPSGLGRYTDPRTREILRKAAAGGDAGAAVGVYTGDVLDTLTSPTKLLQTGALLLLGVGLILAGVIALTVEHKDTVAKAAEVLA